MDESNDRALAVEMAYSGLASYLLGVIDSSCDDSLRERVHRRVDTYMDSVSKAKERDDAEA